MKFDLRNLTYRYGGNAQPSLCDVSLSIDTGAITGLAGANGSGKTTLIRVLLGQLADYDGSYAIDGTPVRDWSGSLPATWRIGYCPDMPVLDDTLTGYEILRLVAQLRGMEATAFADQVALFRRHLLIDDWVQTRQCAVYSTGMRRKVAIAIAYLGPIHFAVLDEPLNGLDPPSMAGLREIARARCAQGVGSLISTHILGFIENTGDRVVMLAQGQCRFEGPVETACSPDGTRQSLESVYLRLFDSGRTSPS